MEYQIKVRTFSPELYAILQTEITKMLHELDMEASTPKEKRTIAYAINNMKREIL